jgi:AIPR protein
MKPEELNYTNLAKLIKKYESKGRGESASFLNWFLEQIYRLDETAADDAICDRPNDKGIDGIYVDHTSNTIHLFSTKIAQKSGRTIGDVDVKNLQGSMAQFRSKKNVELVQSSKADPELKKIIDRERIANFVEQGYKVKGVFVTNKAPDKNTEEYLAHVKDIVVYDPIAIAREYIEFDAADGVEGTFTFLTDYAGILEFSVSNEIDVFLFPAAAKDLVKLDGIASGQLFNQNVRFSLGNTAVNKAIATSIANKAEHKYFPLYHNGITILCDAAKKTEGRLKITNYVVVNGAQSISTFFGNEGTLSRDLRVFVKVICLRDEQLARKITLNSNNQNAIKPRDLRSNHDIMRRLKAEFAQHQDYEFEIKRGEEFPTGKTVISNEEAGRMLLAFDQDEPYSCHQIYRVFDDKYSDIFGRPEVDANRIIFLYKIMLAIDAKLDEISHKQLAGYALTRFFLLSLVAHILEKFDSASKWLANKDTLRDVRKQKAVLDKLPALLDGIIVDLNYEIQEHGDNFDYKKDLKAPERVRFWRDAILRSYEKDLKKGKAVSF